MPVILKLPTPPLVSVTPVGDGWRIDISQDLVPKDHTTVLAELSSPWPAALVHGLAEIIQDALQLYHEAIQEDIEDDGTEEERKALLYPVLCPGCGADFKIELSPADAVQPDTENSHG